MRHNGCIEAGERAQPEQFRGVELSDRGELLPPTGRPAAAHEADSHGLQWGAVAAF